MLMTFDFTTSMGFAQEELQFDAHPQFWLVPSTSTSLGILLLVAGQGFLHRITVVSIKYYPSFVFVKHPIELDLAIPHNALLHFFVDCCEHNSNHKLSMGIKPIDLTMNHTSTGHGSKPYVVDLYWLIENGILQFLGFQIPNMTSTQNTLWLFNMAVENDPFIDDFPMKPPFIVDFPWLC